MLNSNSYRKSLENCFCVSKQSFADVPQNKCSEKFCKFDRKTPKRLQQSVFNKVAGLHACNFVKKRLQHRWYLVKFVKFLRTLFFCTTPFDSDCFCVFWKSGENFSSQQLKKSPVGRQQLYRELHCRHSRGNFSKLIKQYPQLFLLLSWALWNFELYLYLCSIVNNSQINNAVILSFQNM